MTMKERPILFSAPMVRAIRDGRKTQLRRVVKPQPPSVESVSAIAGIGFSIFTDEHTPGKFRVAGPVWCVRDLMGREPEWKCPYGIPGDRLWVRECWTPDHRDFYPHFPAVYKADAAYDYDRNEKGEVYSPEQKSWYPYRWRPSIHMPRWASRITLEVVAVRVERLQEISEADSLAEGIHQFGELEIYGYDPKGTPGTMIGATATEAFFWLWQQINSLESWSANPWVWVVEFRKLET